MEDFHWLPYLAPALVVELLLITFLVFYFSRREDKRRNKESNLTRISAPLFGSSFGLGALWRREGKTGRGDGGGGVEVDGWAGG
jgi:cytochrome c oxidase assembly factor CtaG